MYFRQKITCGFTDMNFLTGYLAKHWHFLWLLGDNTKGSAAGNVCIYDTAHCAVAGCISVYSSYAFVL